MVKTEEELLLELVRDIAGGSNLAIGVDFPGSPRVYRSQRGSGDWCFREPGWKGPANVRGSLAEVVGAYKQWQSKEKKNAD